MHGLVRSCAISGWIEATRISKLPWGHWRQPMGGFWNGIPKLWMICKLHERLVLYGFMILRTSYDYSIYGFLKQLITFEAHTAEWGYLDTPKWMVYLFHGKSAKNGWFGGSHFRTHPNLQRHTRSFGGFTCGIQSKHALNHTSMV